MKRIVFGIMISMVLAACDQKDLCVTHSPRSFDWEALQVRYNRFWQMTLPGGIDWPTVWEDYDFGIPYSSLLPDVPAGVRVAEYDDGALIGIYNIGPYGGEISLADDDNSLLLYNNDSEYIVYSGIDTIADASATTRSVQRSTYQGSPYVSNSTRFVNPPDMLYSAFIEEVEDAQSDNDHLVKVVMQPVVYTYLVRYRFVHGLDYVAIARGALAGMAADVSLETGIAGSDAVTILYDCQLTNQGAQAIVKSFGAPSCRPDQTFGLNLEVRLKNGKILDFNFDVTSQLAMQPMGGVVDIGGIDIPDNVGKEDPGVFNVDIEGWGEFEDIPIQF